MLGFIKKIIRLLNSIGNFSNQAKYISLNNQKCETQPTHINLHLNDDNQELHYYSSAVNLDRCVWSCNNLNDLSNKLCVPNKTEDLNVSVCNMITGISESKLWTKHVSNVYENVYEMCSMYQNM